MTIKFIKAESSFPYAAFSHARQKILPILWDATFWREKIKGKLQVHQEKAIKMACVILTGYIIQQSSILNSYPSANIRVLRRFSQHLLRYVVWFHICIVIHCWHAGTKHHTYIINVSHYFAFSFSSTVKILHIQICVTRVIQ